MLEGHQFTPAGDVAPGEYLLVVVHGPAQVKVNTAGSTAIQPGDLLSTSTLAGSAGKAAMVSLDGVQTAVPGTVLGKALEAASGTDGMMYIFVTLQ